MTIALPLFKQEQDFTCVLACIRIVLHGLGVELPETKIAEVCNATPFGLDQFEAYDGIMTLGFRATVRENAGFDEVVKLLRKQQPVIAFVSVKYLPYAKDQKGTHAVVVSGFGEDNITFVDPARGEEINLELDTFLKAWQSRGRIGIVIDLPSTKEL